MNKIKLIKAIKDKIGGSEDTAEKYLDAVTGIITEQLKAGSSVKLRGFGVFAAKFRKARKIHNPHTGGKVDVPGKIVPVFTASSDMRKKFL